jgi:hypothetical protein
LVYGVTLVKKHDGLGLARKGETFRVAFRKGWPRDEAERRAFRILVRDRASENPMQWEVVDA